MFESILNPIFSPLLKIPALLAVVIMSIIASLIVILVYKYTTDQDLMKRLKDEIKEFQKEMKELKQHPEKMMQVQKKAMQTNMKYMAQSMKATLITFIPVILIFSWMSSNFAYEPIIPNQEFTTSAIFEKGFLGQIEIVAPTGIKINGDAVKKIEGQEASWLLKGTKGEYLLEYKVNGNSYTQQVLITDEQAYKPVSTPVKNSQLKELRIGNKKKIVLPIGYKDWLGWLGTYIILSIILSIVLRKVMKVY